MRRRSLAALAGMIGPLLFMAIFMFEGWLRPGYDAREMFVSELSLGPRGWIQIANFLVYGVLFLVFTYGVAVEFQSGKASQAGPILLTIIGISLFFSGIFVVDPVTTPVEQMSLSGRLHVLFGAVVFSLMPISCFVFFRRFRADPKWQSLQWWTLAAGILIAAAVVLLSVGPTEPPAAPNVFNAWIGAIQRTALIPYFLWQFTFAAQLRIQNNRAGQANAR